MKRRWEGILLGLILVVAVVAYGATNYQMKAGKVARSQMAVDGGTLGATDEKNVLLVDLSHGKSGITWPHGLTKGIRLYEWDASWVVDGQTYEAQLGVISDVGNTTGDFNIIATIDIGAGSSLAAADGGVAGSRQLVFDPPLDLGIVRDSALLFVTNDVLDDDTTYVVAETCPGGTTMPGNGDLVMRLVGPASPVVTVFNTGVVYDTY